MSPCILQYTKRAKRICRSLWLIRMSPQVRNELSLGTYSCTAEMSPLGPPCFPAMTYHVLLSFCIRLPVSSDTVRTLPDTEHGHLTPDCCVQFVLEAWSPPSPNRSMGRGIQGLG